MDTDNLYSLEASVQTEALQLAKDVDVVCLSAEDGMPLDENALSALDGHIASIREALCSIEQAIDEIFSS